jgi:hypothetical protein
MTQQQVDAVQAAGWRCIAINCAYLRAPWADILYFGDDRFYTWHKNRAEFRAFAGRKIAFDCPGVYKDAPHIPCMKNGARTGLCAERNRLAAGSNSGYQAINLAVHLGAQLIALLGYDMRTVGDRTHWHDGHPIKTPAHAYAQVMLPKFPTLVEPLKQRGVRVVNCTPDSALTVFEAADFDDIKSL